MGAGALEVEADAEKRLSATFSRSSSFKGLTSSAHIPPTRPRERLYDSDGGGMISKVAPVRLSRRGPLHSSSLPETVGENDQRHERR